jgi:hypothetical protein
MAEVKTGLEGVLKIAWGQTGTDAAQDGSTIGYVTGFDYEWSDSPLHVYDGSGFAHSKKQRGHGRATAKQLFVNNNFYNKLGTSTADETYGRHYIELQVDGILGTCEDVYSFEDCVLENLSRSHPEEESVTEEWTFHFAKAPRYIAAASKLIN